MTKTNGIGGGYEVGYGKPPKHSRFKKGTSANPEGRRPGSKNKPTTDGFSKMLREEGTRFIDVKEKGKLKKMNTDRAIMRSVFIAAASGNIKAQKLSLDILSKDATRRSTENRDRFDAAADYKKWWTEESMRRRLHGEPEPRLMFHPDDFHLNYEAGTVTYTGMTERQEEYVTSLLELKGFHEGALISLAEEEPVPKGENIALVWEDLKHIVSMLEKINAALDLPWRRDVETCPDLKKLKELKGEIMREMKLKGG
jgi:hypothetical protein